MRLVPILSWRLDGDPAAAIDDRLLPLLDAIVEAHSLTAAVERCDMSYRAAWGLLRDCERVFGEPLVRLERGRGASLTPTGSHLRAGVADSTRRLARLAPPLDVEVRPSRRAESPPEARLRVVASHDLALAALAESLPDETGLSLDLSFMGSLSALEEFASGRAEAAGFHVPIAGFASLDHAPYRKWLRARRDRLVRFVDREQGLILQRGNPARVRHFRDLAGKELRFVNRQRGSGTRLLIDRIIEDAGIDAASINGYRTEEFTHAAVAATVASGGADVGFGLRASAAEYRLAFVPLVRERYFLAIRASSVHSPAVLRLIGALRGPMLTRITRGLEGYRATAAGSIARLSTLDGAPGE
jgi:molybdate transport repressor ModE-like protein